MERKAEEVIAFVQDKVLVQEIIQKQIKRIRRVRKTLGWTALKKEDVHEDVETAIMMGYYHALVNRFMAEKGITHEWILEQRRSDTTPSLTGNDRTWDSVIVQRNFPEFEAYYPTEPITREEVVEMAQKEFYDLLCSYGTDYREIRKATEGTKATYSEAAYVELGPDNQIVHMLDLSDLSDDDVLGPSITHLAMRAIDMLGPRLGIYYIFEKLFFQDKHTALLRALGGEEARRMNPQEFEAAKRDLHRKLNEVEDFHEMMRNDGEFKELFERIKLGNKYDPTQ